MIRRLAAAVRPTETRFFLFIGGFGIVLAAIYWLLTYELAGTVLLLGFGGGGALVGIVLLLDRRRARTVPAPDDGDAGATPFGDERGRLPDETLAPLALGLGIALALTAVVFGPWLVVAGAVPLGWGAWTWLGGARDELDATAREEGGRPAGASPDPAQPTPITTRATSDDA